MAQNEQFIPVPHVVVEVTRFITKPWMMFFQAVSDGLKAAGDVFGPASSVNDQIVLFSGTTGKLIKAATGTGYVRTDTGVYSAPTHAATSVLGRAANSTGDMADIAATADGQVLTRQAGALTFASGANLGGYWTLVTNGDPTVPEVIFDSNGDVIAAWVPV